MDATARMMAKFVRVLIVHDEDLDVADLYASLRKEFILRVATSPSDALEIVRTVPLACVVCAAGKEICARDLFEETEKTTPDQARRFVFLRSPDATDHDAVFFLTAGKTWLPMPVAPEELLAVVRATSAKE